MWFGLTSIVIIYFISTRNRPLSQVIMTCVRQSTDTDREFVPAIFEEVEMSDEFNYIWCRECGRLVHYTPANTVIYFFVDYVWYTAAETHCHYCDYKQALFLIDNLDWLVGIDLTIQLVIGDLKRRNNTTVEAVFTHLCACKIINRVNGSLL